MVNLKTLIKKSKKPLKANATFNGAVKTDMDAAISEIIAYGKLYG